MLEAGIHPEQHGVARSGIGNLVKDTLRAGLANLKQATGEGIFTKVNR